MQIDTGKALNHEVEDILLSHRANLFRKLKAFEDIKIGREAINIMFQICLEACGVAQQSPQSPLAGVVERQTSYAPHLCAQHIWVVFMSLNQGSDTVLVSLENAVQTAQNRHRQDDITVLFRLIRAAQDISGAPDKRAQVAHVYLLSSDKRILVR